jgi:hypothetical protein
VETAPKAYDFSDVASGLMMVCHVPGAIMADEATVALLQEIRDLQRQQLECLRTSLANQQQSLGVQQQVVERQKMLVTRSTKLWLYVLGSIFVLFFLYLVPIFSKFVGRH